MKIIEIIRGSGIKSDPMPRWACLTRVTMGVIAACTLAFCSRAAPVFPERDEPATTSPALADHDRRSQTNRPDPHSLSLFDGKTLAGWAEAGFAGRGEVKVVDGRIVLGMGYMTGIVYTNRLPQMNYEVTLEAMRVEGSDFFCGLTFPVGSNTCSLIVGGWGGGVVGLSNLDGEDAANNETTSYHSFEKGRWYAIRLRVTPERIEAWIDKERVVSQEFKDRRVSIRFEMEPCVPFGIATWSTTGAVRNIRLNRL